MFHPGSVYDCVTGALGRLQSLGPPSETSVYWIPFLFLLVRVQSEWPREKGKLAAAIPAAPQS